ncbi:MAG TPA: GyrI-like domain-containing protein [Terriglobales bacterium]|nr:GyrI-like domain-containing protein [Terriglobales bacterium]
MEWLERLNGAMTYLEANIAEFDLARAAQLACCSPFHFQRMFSYLAEVPLSEYIRRRKMSRAAADLAGGNEKIVDLALKYGYDSPTAFNRAFQSVHGVAPSTARQDGITLKAYPPISFKIVIRGEEAMDYRIEKKEAFRIVGFAKHFQMNLEESFAKVPKFWAETVQNGNFMKLFPLMAREPAAILGVSMCMNGEDFDYYIAVASDCEPPEGMASALVPACAWAVFPCVGAMPQAIQTLQKRIVAEWLPASGYEYANAPDIEVYFEGDQTAPDYRCEVWLPVQKSALLPRSK